MWFIFIESAEWKLQICSQVSDRWDKPNLDVKVEAAEIQEMQRLLVSAAVWLC